MFEAKHKICMGIQDRGSLFCKERYNDSENLFVFLTVSDFFFVCEKDTFYRWSKTQSRIIAISSHKTQIF